MSPEMAFPLLCLGEERASQSEEERSPAAFVLSPASTQEWVPLGRPSGRRVSSFLPSKLKGVKISSHRKASVRRGDKLKKVYFTDETVVDRPSLEAGQVERFRNSFSSCEASISSTAPSCARCPVTAAPLREDILSPLTEEETELIKIACGIIVAGSTPSAPGDGGVSSAR